MSTRRQFVTGCAALTAVTGLGMGSVLQSQGRERGPMPNIVLIAADDLGYAELGRYGQRFFRTPRLDRLAAEGLRFTQAYAGAPVCAPSRCSLLTGLHAGHGAVRSNAAHGRQPSLSARDTTFAEVLKASGYRTACVGKWGFGPEEPGQASHPNARGFDEFFGYLSHRHAHDYFPGHLWHNGERHRLPEGRYAVDALEDHALEFIRQAAEEGPFLLYLAPNLPHAPNELPAAEASAYRGRLGRPADRRHAAQVMRLDRMAGAVTDTLRRLGIARNTLVLFMSDNGPHEEGGTDPDVFDATGSLRGCKRNLYEGGIRVPLIAWWPGTVTPGAATGRPTPLTDVLPTLAELAGQGARPRTDGLSLVPLLRGTGAAQAHDHLYWYRSPVSGTFPRAGAAEGGRLDRVAEAVRRGNWKAVRFAPGRDREAPDEEWDFELYDLAADRGEAANVAADHPELAGELTTLLRSAWTEPAG